MKVAIARGPGQFGGIYRRFRELCAYCAGRHEVVGLLLLADSDETVSEPVRTLAYGRGALSVALARAETIDDVLAGCEPLIARLARDLSLERPDRVLAADTDLKGLSVVAACRRAGVPVTTHVASIAHMDAAFAARPSMRMMPEVERYCLEQSDRLIFPSAFAADACAARVPLMAPHLVIHNGIAASFLQPAPFAPAARRIGAVMRMSAIKNPQGLARIAGALAGRGYALDVVTTLPRGASPLASLGNVSIVEPTLCSDTLATFYRTHEAIVCPSLFEASGNVPMEAVAAGAPAVITDRMGTAEVFRELGLGHLVVGVNDIDATVARLVGAEPIPEAIRARVRSAYAWPAVCARIMSAVEQLEGQACAPCSFTT